MIEKLRAVVLLAPLSLGVVVTACGSYTTGATGSSGGSISSNGGSTSSSGGSTSTTGGTVSSAGLPCDILARSGHPCVSAHSTVRALVSGYSGNLYQVKLPNGTTKEIGVVDGYADAASQDAVCSGGGCVVTIIYDQSPQKNDLTPAPPGGAKPTPGNPANAADLKVTINGHAAYGLLFRPGMGYRKLIGSGTAVGDEPETMYMVSSQKDLINGCCFVGSPGTELEFAL